jgi:hypothetical protein
MRTIFGEHQNEKTLQAPSEVLEVIGDMSKSQSTELLADEEKRRRKRARR